MSNRRSVRVGDDSVFLGYACADILVETVQKVVDKSAKWAEVLGVALPSPMEIHCKSPELMPELSGVLYVEDDEIAYDRYLFVRVVDEDADRE